MVESGLKQVMGGCLSSKAVLKCCEIVQICTKVEFVRSETDQIIEQAGIAIARAAQMMEIEQIDG